MSQTNKQTNSQPSFLQIVPCSPCSNIAPYKTHYTLALITQTLRDTLKSRDFSGVIPGSSRVYLFPSYILGVAHTPVVAKRMSWKPHSLGLGLQRHPASICPPWWPLVMLLGSHGKAHKAPSEQLQMNRWQPVPTVTCISKDIWTSKLTQGVSDLT